jgi:hypothetical protein
MKKSSGSTKGIKGRIIKYGIKESEQMEGGMREKEEYQGKRGK